MGSCISGGGGNVIHDFCTWRTGDGGGKILKCSTFDLLIFIKQYSDSMCFQFLDENYESYLIYVKYMYAPLPPFGAHKKLLNSNLVSKLVSTAAK